MWLDYFATYLRETFPQFLREKTWNYKDDLCVVGAYDLYGATGEARWLEPIRASAPFLMDDAGRVAGWQPGEHNLDKVSFGKSLRILGQLTGEARYARGAQAAFRMLADYPRTVTGNFWHKDIYPHQVWLDGLYMAMPFYAACLDEYGADASAHRLLWDEAKGLYRHANDCSRQAGWADPATGQSPAVWLRAEGWFLMALADTYELARAHTPRAGELAALLQNYPETSGSAMAAYALMKGARLGMLPPACGQTGSDILDGIRTAYLAPSGGRTLCGICASAGLGPGPDHRNGGQPARRRRLHDGRQRAAAAQMR